MPRDSSSDNPDHADAPPAVFHASAGQVSCPASPGRGIVWNTQRSAPVRTSKARTAPGTFSATFALRIRRSRQTTPGVTPLNVNTTTLAWSTPWELAGARVQFFLGAPYSAVAPQDSAWQSGFGQPLLAGQLAWDLGNDFGLSYLLGGYFPSQTRFTTQTSSLTHRFALSYVGNDWNLTAHLFYGHFLGDRPPPGAVYPDYMNLDLTATRNFGKWQIGAVAFGSTDLPTGVASYRPQGQIAVGGLIGYNFGPVNLQAFVTRDVIDRAAKPGAVLVKPERLYLFR